MSDTRPPLLIVEDDPALQTQMTWAFDRYEPVPAGDRDSALAQVRRHRPAVVTMDLGLPPHPNEPTEGLRLLQDILSIAPLTRGERATRAGGSLFCRHQPPVRLIYQ